METVYPKECYILYPWRWCTLIIMPSIAAQWLVSSQVWMTKYTCLFLAYFRMSRNKQWMYFFFAHYSSRCHFKGFISKLVQGVWKRVLEPLWYKKYQQFFILLSFNPFFLSFALLVHLPRNKLFWKSSLALPPSQVLSISPGKGIKSFNSFATFWYLDDRCREISLW